MDMFPIKSFLERFGESLEALDDVAEACDADAADDLEDLNAELEDALLLLEELKPQDGQEALVDALEALRALAGDYCALSDHVPALAPLASLSAGTRTIALTVGISSAAALLFPRKEDETDA